MDLSMDLTPSTASTSSGLTRVEGSGAAKLRSPQKRTGLSGGSHAWWSAPSVAIQKKEENLERRQRSLYGSMVQRGNKFAHRVCSKCPGSPRVCLSTGTVWPISS